MKYPTKLLVATIAQPWTLILDYTSGFLTIKEVNTVDGMGISIRS